MDPIVALIIGLVVGLVLGAVIGLLLARTRRAAAGGDPAVVEARHQQALSELRSQENDARVSLQTEAARLTEMAGGLERQLLEAQSQYRQLLEQNRVDAAERSAKEARENKILESLAPVRETLETMQRKVADIEVQRSQQHGELTQQLKSSLESEGHIRATAESLASALRSNSTRGVWGETQLRRLVEAAGLLEHVNFTEQQSVSSDAGSGRIDMVVHLSDGKDLAVDAKVPFTSFLEANEIPITAVGLEAERRARLLAEHSRAMKAHVDALAKREYWEGLATSPDLVIGFIPSESLLAAALENDPTLLDYAFRKNVALASPVTLWAVLKTVAYSWRQEAMSKDAKRIFDLSSELYTRVRKLAEYAEGLRRSIESTVNNYNRFASSLETRVLVTARKIDESGDPSHAIPELGRIETSPKPLTAADLIDEGTTIGPATLDIIELEPDENSAR